MFTKNVRKNNTFLTTLIIVAVLAAFIGLIFLAKQAGGEKKSTANLILFFGNTCPHCENVDAYMEANNTREKIDIEELEVYDNQANAQLLVKKAKDCGLDTSGGVGVPFLFDNGTCILGDEPIIEVLKNK